MRKHEDRGAAAPARPEAPRARTKYVAVRLDEATIRRIDALVAGLSSEWIKARRADVLRKVILSGLAQAETRQDSAERGARRARGAPASRRERRRARSERS